MSSGFITESEIEEKKRRRQEEWDKVRKPEDPIEVPAEPVDNRSLFDRLQEQKNKKQEEFEEAHKLKNLVKGLDDDEVLFLDQVDQVKLQEEKRKRLEEAKELNDFRNAVSELREKEYQQAIYQEIGLTSKQKAVPANTLSIGTKPKSQSMLLSSVVKRKHSLNTSDSPDVDAKKLKGAETTHSQTSNEVSKQVEESKEPIPSVPYKGNLVCIGVLPGLSSYTNSDDDDDEDCEHDNDDSDSTGDCESHCHKNNITDLCGRKIEYETKRDSN